MEDRLRHASGPVHILRIRYMHVNKNPTTFNVSFTLYLGEQENNTSFTSFTSLAYESIIIT